VAAVVERGGHFLLVEEQDARGRLVVNQPAGHLDPGESLQQAVVRETREETAWGFLPEAVVGIYLYRSADRGVTYLRVCFSGSCTDHDPEQRLDAGVQRSLWLSRDEIAALGARARSPMVLRCTDDYLAGQRFPLQLLGQLQDA
jgi:8-oxo-dGTP pyrophosphatase MutT (NUDIX family)